MIFEGNPMRLFIALELPSTVNQYIKTLQDKLKNKNLFIGTYPNPEHLHVTLVFLGDCSEAMIPKITHIMEQITTPIEIQLDGVNLDNQNRPHVIWVDLISDHLKNVVTLLNQQLDIHENRPFRGHITVARIKKCTTPHETLKKIVDSFPKNPLTFIGTSLTLYESTLTSQGPIYTSKYTQKLIAAF